VFQGYHGHPSDFVLGHWPSWTIFASSMLLRFLGNKCEGEGYNGLRRFRKLSFLVTLMEYKHYGTYC
jgi:hypothetical protein